MLHSSEVSKHLSRRSNRECEDKLSLTVKGKTGRYKKTTLNSKSEYKETNNEH